MHELPIMEQILKAVLKHTASNNVQKVAAIHLQVGRLSDLQDEWMQRYFDYLSKGTVAEGAQLKIERMPVQMKCQECSNIYDVDLDKMERPVCPKCGKTQGALVSGRQYVIKSMEVS